MSDDEKDIDLEIAESLAEDLGGEVEDYLPKE